MFLNLSTFDVRKDCLSCMGGITTAKYNKVLRFEMNLSALYFGEMKNRRYKSLGPQKK